MKEKILLIIVSIELRELLNIFLSENYEVKACENRLEALLVLNTEYVPDIILSENIIPSLDGMRLLLQLKKSSVLKHIPVLILSNISGMDMKVEFINAGADGYLLKPFSLGQLNTIIEKLLENRKNKFNVPLSK